MKTPSFGNNSGPDDHYAMFNSTERREKGIEATAPVVQKRVEKTPNIAKEVEYITLNKKDKMPESKSVLLEEVSHQAHEDNLIKYASKMGHKKSIQRFSKGSAGSGKTSAVQYFKPKNTFRNQMNTLTQGLNSKTFVDTHNFDLIDTSEGVHASGHEFDTNHRQDESMPQSLTR